MIERLYHIVLREIAIFSRRPLMLFSMLLAPIFCLVLFTSMMGSGLPTKLPAGLVDEDDTHVTRQLVRILNSMEQTNLEKRYATFSEARVAMQRGEINSFFYIPKGTTEEAIANRQPKISFCINDAYFVSGSLLMRDMRLISELVGLAVVRETLYAHGYTNDRAMGVVQPIVIETHPLGNSFLNYSVYLNNVILPGILSLFIMLITSYNIGLEWKNGTQKELYAMAGESSVVALLGKLIPQTVVFSLVMMLYDVVFYKYLAFPCLCGVGKMMLLGFLFVLVSQAFGILAFAIFMGQLRMAMSMCSLWGVISFSMAGLSFPLLAMDPILQYASWLFPLRHYYVIYLNQALNGYDWIYVWPHVLALFLVMLLPLLLVWRYRYGFKYCDYKP